MGIGPQIVLHRTRVHGAGEHFVSIVALRGVDCGQACPRPRSAILLRNVESDLDRLKRLKSLSWLSASDLAGLANGLVLANFKRHEVIAREAALASDAHLLLSGVASITCLNARGERVTVALLAPGPIPKFPAMPVSLYGFQSEAHSDCRVGRLSWERLNALTSNAPQSAFMNFHENNLKQWYRLLIRGSSFLSLDLRERIAIALLELCSDFGVEETRGTLLRIPFTHRELANLVGASRPRVTEHLVQLEREGLVVRQGRQLVVHTAQLGNSIATRAA
jgi:CRP-like cAMP-binding protein